MIERKIDALSDADRRLLLAAQRARGIGSTQPVVALAAEMDAAGVEDRLEHLESAAAMVACLGERDLPDRTPNLRYQFVHILYQQAFYRSLRGTGARR